MRAQPGRVDEVGVVDASEVMERASYTPGFGPREVGGIGQNIQQHVGRVKNLSAVPMGGHEAEEPLQIHNRPLRRRGKDACQGAGGREDPTIHTPLLVEQIADGNL